MWRIKGLIRGILAIIYGREWLIKKTHDDIFSSIKKQKKRMKDNWSITSLGFFEFIRKNYANTWENEMTNEDKEVWLNLYEKDIVALILELEYKEYESCFKTI